MQTYVISNNLINYCLKNKLFYKYNFNYVVSNKKKKKKMQQKTDESCFLCVYVSTNMTFQLYCNNYKQYNNFKSIKEMINYFVFEMSRNMSRQNTIMKGIVSRGYTYSPQ